MQGFVDEDVFFCVCVFYTEIQDGRQQRRGNDFWGKSAEDSAILCGSKTLLKSFYLGQFSR